MAYDNTQRAAGALSTRTQILDAARTLFLEHGFGTTTIREIAERAGVSQETIYKSLGSKAAVLKAVWDVTLAGNDDDLPLAERPEAAAVGAANNPDDAARAYCELAAVVSARTDPLLRVLLGSHHTDRGLGEFAETIAAERLSGSTAVVGHWHGAGWLRADLSVAKAAEILWALNSPQPRWLLHDSGWSRAEFTNWLAETVRHAILA